MSEWDCIFPRRAKTRIHVTVGVSCQHDHQMELFACFWSGHHSGFTLSIDWPLFWALTGQLLNKRMRASYLTLLEIMIDNNSGFSTCMSALFPSLWQTSNPAQSFLRVLRWEKRCNTLPQKNNIRYGEITT